MAGFCSRELQDKLVCGGEGPLLPVWPQAVTSGANPVNIKRGIDKTCAFLVDRLQENAVPVSGSSDIRSVATISAGNDAVVGAMIAEALDKVPNVRPVSDRCRALSDPSLVPGQAPPPSLSVAAELPLKRTRSGVPQPASAIVSSALCSGGVCTVF